MRSGRYDGSPRGYFFQRVVSSGRQSNSALERMRARPAHHDRASVGARRSVPTR